MIVKYGNVSEVWLTESTLYAMENAPFISDDCLQRGWLTCCLCVQFFAPIEPLHIDIELTRGGRASGDAMVEFESDSDVREAMKRHREMIGLLLLRYYYYYYYYYY